LIRVEVFATQHDNSVGRIGTPHFLPIGQAAMQASIDHKIKGPRPQVLDVNGGRLRGNRNHARIGKSASVEPLGMRIVLVDMGNED
jgi:hypothetical protein